jgi:aspartate/tyrosine/aromatic aminotransferase
MLGRRTAGALALMCMAMTHIAGASRWAGVPMAPADPILGVAVAFNADPAKEKVNLGIGAYRDSDGKPLVLRCVREAEKSIANDNSLNKEYLPVQVSAPALMACG